MERINVLKLITDRSELEKCQRQFQHRLQKALTKTGNFIIGYHGDSHENEFWYNKRFWYAPQIIDNSQNPRYWNSFGTNLREQYSNSIIVEINIPIEGDNKKVSGLFAKDLNTREVFLLHRGRIGGGKKGVGKEAFLNWYSGIRVEITGKKVEEVILITSLKDPSFIDNLLYFIHKVSEFKHLTTQGSIEIYDEILSKFNSLTYDPEFRGKKKISFKSYYTAECNHGRIVDALKVYLENENKGKKLNFYNDRYIDLAILDRKKVVKVYEVKANFNNQSIYTALGQLIFHGNLNNAESFVLVLPKMPLKYKHFLKSLSHWKIDLIEYELNGEEIHFKK